MRTTLYHVAIFSALAALVMAGGASAAPFGVNAHIPSPTLLDEAVDAGMHWVRIDVAWAFIEPERDVLQWQLYDELVDEATARGLRIFGTLQATPAWATAGSEFSGVPRSPADWQELCYQVAKRYRGRVAAWSLWNEPNLSRFWQGSREQYIEEILRPGIVAIRAADPHALVCGPDLAHLSSGSWDSWLRSILRASGDDLDVVTHHAYPSNGSHADVTAKLDGSPSYPWDDPPLREVLADNGWRNRPVWLAETGVESDAVGEGAQASFVSGLLGTWFHPQRSRSWLSRVFFYELEDNSGFSWGLLGPAPERRRKPAFEAHRRYAEQTPVDDAEIQWSELPRTVQADTTTPLRILVRNSGSTIWTPETHQLSVGIDSDESWQAAIEALPSPISPGEGVSLTVWLTAPPYYPYVLPVPMDITVRMERIGEWTFGPALFRRILFSQYDLPTLLRSPDSWTATIGSTVVLTVQATSQTPMTYSWRRNSVELSDDDRYEGANSPRLEIVRSDSSTAGDYDCLITNFVGSTASTMATVTLIDRDGPRQASSAQRRQLPSRWLAWHRYRGITPPAAPGNDRQPRNRDDLAARLR